LGQKEEVGRLTGWAGLDQKGPRQSGGPCTLENELGQKNKKEEKIKDGLQGTFGPKSNQAAEQNRKLFSNF
jgi:hypothetical protein